jgi:hypothetical protein
MPALPAAVMMSGCDDPAAAFDLPQTSAAGDDATLARLRSLIQQRITLEERIEKGEAHLKKLKEEARRLSEKDIPDLMTTIQSTNFDHAGWQIKLVEKVDGSLPKEPEKRLAAIRWLEEHGGDGIITTAVSVNFARSQREEALEASKLLTVLGHSPKVDSSVHPMTLAAFARERLKKGEPLDADVLGLYVRNVAEVKPVKKPSRE